MDRNNTPDIRIYVCHHKKWEYLSNNVITPIQVGRKISDTILENMIGDDTGNNISDLNREWCELTALYWIWKNTDHDYTGLMHYRRYLSFNEHSTEDQHISQINADIIHYNGWTQEDLQKFFLNYDIATTPTYEIHPPFLPELKRTAYVHYSEEHYKNDIDTTLQIIKEKFPEYYIQSLKCMNQKSTICCNISVMRRDIFNKYCEFIFNILFEVEKIITINYENSYQRRVFGFLAERLTNIFIEHIRNTDKKINILNNRMVYINKEIDLKKEHSLTLEINKKNTHFNFSNVNVCITLYDQYSLGEILTIDSIIKNSRNRRKINFYIFYRQENIKKKLSVYYKKYSRNFHFIELSEASFPESCFLNSLPLEKFIFVKGKMIFEADIHDYWAIDMQDKIIAGSLEDGNILHSRRLFGRESNENYINTDIFIYDLKKATDKYGNISFRHCESLFHFNQKIIYREQDIINISHKNDIFIIDLTWNAHTGVFFPNDRDRSFSDKEMRIAFYYPKVINFCHEKDPTLPSSNHEKKNIYYKYLNRYKFSFSRLYFAMLRIKYVVNFGVF